MKTEKLTLLIRTDLEDRNIEAVDVQDAAKTYREYVERENLGASDVGFGKVFKGKTLVATIYYNGTIRMEN